MPTVLRRRPCATGSPDVARGLASLPEAIEWARAHWQGRELPTRIHEHAVEPDSLLGSPRLTATMMSYLLASPDDTVTRTETVLCRHPRGSERHCPDCTAGVKSQDITRRRYPMWRALWRVSLLRPVRDGLPQPVYLVLALWAAGWRPELVRIRTEDGAPLEPDDRDGLLLRALRSLHHEYEDTVVPRVGWVSKSEAQRKAEEVAA